MTRHEHRWSEWGRWYFASGNVDQRDRDCRDCEETDSRSRAHAHDFKSYPDPYAPVGSGLVITVCALCHAGKRK